MFLCQLYFQKFKIEPRQLSTSSVIQLFLNRILMQTIRF